MHYRRLGRSGLKVSEISLGAWVTFGNQVDEKLADELIHAAYDQGVNFFDNADMYANGQAETLMGKAIRDLPREALVISSKVFWPTMPGPNGRGLSRKHVTESIHASLRRLQTDYVDLYFCHRFDPDTPVEEVVYTMNDLIHQGKVLYWGTSEWEPHQIMEAIGVARANHLIGPTMEQPQYNMFHRKRVENFLAPVCREQGIGLTTFSPLYYGILSGKYNDGIPEGSRASLESMAWMRDRITPERIQIVRQLTALAGEIGATTSQLAIAWVLRRKEVSSVITGASSLEQLDENLQAADLVERLTDDVLETIEQIIGNFPE
ncbi:MAG TPA: aldo/keto reductase [Anaerolinea thermolimosa]|uniref:Aldo/keto reductase n=1 Tax=Anaerolinea thermolimosa TaxID=229919 RepID=A0A3D1JFC1_9CHLR|nr:aldo/keto reductase [Anaerolinea thermolimosa]GAP08354.1 predicted oxidoreductase related to aryl-alcohol dehydrogenases [Anaerolinea thermolimosa]HCE16937.1 aldo/keto reductase [Anaerolinea thermolimosa]